MDRMRPNNGEGKILKDLEEVNNLECMIREPTRITLNSTSLLNVILTNKPELFKKCGTYDPAMSVHCMIYGEMSEKIQEHRPKTITLRQMKNTNFELLSRDLSYAPWHVGDIFSDVDDKYDYWKCLFDRVVDDHAPITEKRVREKDIPYMTSEWKQAIRNKRKYAIQFSKNRTPENFDLKKKVRNIATQERRKAIKTYWFKKSEELKSRPGEFFNTFSPFNKIKNSTLITLYTI